MSFLFQIEILRVYGIRMPDMKVSTLLVSVRWSFISDSWHTDAKYKWSAHGLSVDAGTEMLENKKTEIQFGTGMSESGIL